MEIKMSETELLFLSAKAAVELQQISSDEFFFFSFDEI